MSENKILPQGLEIPDKTSQHQWLKAIVLAILAVASFVVVWWMLNLGLRQVHDLLFWIYAIVAASFGVAFLAFLAVVDINPYLFWGVNLAILAAYEIILPRQPAVLLGGVLFFIFAYLFERHVRADEHSRADFALSRVIHASIIFMVYGLLIVFGFNVYASIKTSFEKNPDVVYDQIGHYAAEGLSLVPSNFGNFNPNQTFDDFVAQQAEQQEPNLASAPKSVQDQILSAFRQQLESRFNIQPNGNQLLGEVVAGAVAEKVKDASSNYSKFFPAIFALLIVIALRYTAFLFIWLTSFVAWVLYKLLLATKFFRIEKVQVEVDKLQI